MAKIDAALDLCVELGKILSETEEFQKMKEAEANLLHGEEARALVEGLQALQMEIQKKKLAGLQLTEEDKKRMQETEAKALANPLVKASFEAHEKFQGVMSLVSTKIREGINSNSQQMPTDEEEEEDLN
ncbi:YlbF family regulator [Desulforamulus ruminis]|uniref:Cell fate regulator YlbF, YheA/YmcA/DUF963 family (Controls sporulation, competence, biofilm development) n=1 Tax=Desulforamulus ruminis (strain ATCC 23193 / DSM 2154 / NCIMB 8452 / DL) TaxID=696281 RepID=F6DKV4_DESRL|nr:YlbF family regulator [Desulforamulus ruminis]AEG61586.1 hypothetical protein Desru_3382 [Desulforamulus ruminis DSM 2154]